MRYLDRFEPLALLVMRLTLGTIMSVHGYTKVFDGPGHFAHMAGGMGLVRLAGLRFRIHGTGWRVAAVDRTLHSAGGVCHLYQPLRCYLEGSLA